LYQTFNEPRGFASAPDEVCDGFLNILRPAEGLLTIGTHQLGLNLKFEVEWDILAELGWKFVIISIIFIIE
jgi:hypothetical protein